MRMHAVASIALGFALGFTGCKPSTVAEAEAKGNVDWLVVNGSPEAAAALGRLSDKNPKALAALNERAKTDVNAYIAAWTATLRGAAWGAATLKAGLADPTRAESAASAMARRDAHLAIFVPELEAALSGPSTGAQSVAVPGALASVGAGAHAAVERRLNDPKTRGLMCIGIASPDASDDARKTLLSVGEGSRDNAECVDAVMRIVATDDTTLAWMAASGESGLFSAIGKSASMPCPRLKVLWQQAIASRQPATYSALAVPLGHGVKRCPTALDPLLAETIAKNPAAHALVVGGIDPYGVEMGDLKTTCGALPIVLRGKAPGRTKDRAADAIAHGCRTGQTQPPR